MGKHRECRWRGEVLVRDGQRSLFVGILRSLRRAGHALPGTAMRLVRHRAGGLLRRSRPHLRAGLWIAVALGVVVSFSATVVTRIVPSARPRNAVSARQANPAGSAAADYATALGIARNLEAVRAGNAVAEAITAQREAGQSPATAAQDAGVFIPSGSSSPLAVPVAQLPGLPAGPSLGPAGPLQQADLFVAAPTALSASAVAAVRKLGGVASADVLDAARIKINGSYVAVLGVQSAAFRAYASAPVADSTALWQNVADGAIAVSYLMGEQERLPLGGTVQVAGVRTEKLLVGGFGTVGISGVDAVVSDQVARSLGMPEGNAMVISAPTARLTDLMSEIERVLPAGASVTPLVAQAPERGPAGSAGAPGLSAASGPGMTVAQTRAFLEAALSRLGMPYVWGGAGPNVFDCSGLVQWSMAQAGIVMPRVAADQAETGPLIQLSDLQPGDLLFYHTDPTAPTYISHVAIYLGQGLMLQAPEPGLDVEIVPAVFGGGFAGAVQVYPRVAAAVAASLAS